MPIYDVLMRGFKDNTLTYDDRVFLWTLSSHIYSLRHNFEDEVQECSRPFDYGLLPRFEPFVIRMWERGCAQFLRLCGEITETDKFDAIRKKYRLTMPKMKGSLTFPYLRFPWGYLEAERTKDGLKFKQGTGATAWKAKRWKERAFANIKRRVRPMYHRDPMFPWRMYGHIWAMVQFVDRQIKERDVVTFQGETCQRSKLHQMSDDTRRATVNMLLCAVAILDDYRRRTIAGEFTSKDTTVFLNKAWIHEIGELKWSGDKIKYLG